MTNSIRVECFLVTSSNQHLLSKEVPIANDSDPLQQSKYLGSDCFAFRFYYESTGKHSVVYGRNGQELCQKPEGPSFLKARSALFAENQRILREKADRDRTTFALRSKI